MQVVDPSCPRQWGSSFCSRGPGGGLAVGERAVGRSRGVVGVWQTITCLSVYLSCLYVWKREQAAAGRRNENGRTETNGGTRVIVGRVRNRVEESGLLVLGLMVPIGSKSGVVLWQLVRSCCRESGAKMAFVDFFLLCAPVLRCRVSGATRTENGDDDSGLKSNRTVVDLETGGGTIAVSNLRTNRCPRSGRSSGGPQRMIDWFSGGMFGQSVVDPGEKSTTREDLDSNAGLLTGPSSSLLLWGRDMELGQVTNKPPYVPVEMENVKWKRLLF